MSVSNSPCKQLKRKSDSFYSEVDPPSQKKQRPSPRRASTDHHEAEAPGKKCDFAFFDCPCEELARNLLGCVLCSDADGERCWGRIVETEAYLGGADKAAHSYNGKRTERNEAMYMPPGTAYVYSIYGMHQCFNISSKGGGAAVLVRALEPLGGVVRMMERRRGISRTKELCNGPAKLCQSLAISKASCNKLDLTSSGVLWVELPEVGMSEGVAKSGRVGVESAGDEWAKKQLRFYFRDSPFVSKK